MKKLNIGIVCLLSIITAFLISANCVAQVNMDRTWSVYKADENSSNYSPLKQITIDNVSQLKSAWTFAMQDKPSGSQAGKSQCNPIIIDGVLYATSASQ
jgi:quinoprotein glucose dehydrogenase